MLSFRMIERIMTRITKSHAANNAEKMPTSYGAARINSTCRSHL